MRRRRDWLAPGRGCIGYCLGGRSILRTIGDHGETSRAAMAVHPSLCTTDDPDSPHLAVASYTGSVDVGFGAADPRQPASANTAFIGAVNALDEGSAEIHDGADHGFVTLGHNHHESAATRSYERAKAIFTHEFYAQAGDLDVPHALFPEALRFTRRWGPP